MVARVIQEFTEELTRHDIEGYNHLRDSFLTVNPETTRICSVGERSLFVIGFHNGTVCRDAEDFCDFLTQAMGGVGHRFGAAGTVRAILKRLVTNLHEAQSADVPDLVTLPKIFGEIKKIH